MTRISEKQREHLEYMRSLRPADWRNTKGAPTKEKLVRDYQKEHPTATRYRCAKDLQISINTVKKWWNNKCKIVNNIQKSHPQFLEYVQKRYRLGNIDD